MANLGLLIGGVRLTLERMRDQAIYYHSFLLRCESEGVENAGREPPPISQDSVTLLEGQLRKIAELSAERDLSFSYLSEDEFERRFAEKVPQPLGGLIGPSLKSLNWTYNVLAQWLDETLVALSLVEGWVIANESSGSVNDSSRSRPKSYSYDVFLSYSHLDEEAAKKILKALDKVGAKTFMASMTLSPGDDFANKIRAALLDARELWILATPNSVRSEWVLSEWGAAWVLGKRVIPILLRCSVTDLPSRLQALQVIDYHEHESLVGRLSDSGGSD